MVDMQQKWYITEFLINIHLQVEKKKKMELMSEIVQSVSLLFYYLTLSLIAIFFKYQYKIKAKF